VADEQKKDTWAKVGLLLQSGGGLLTAVTVAVLGFITSNYLKEREIAETASRERMQANETNVRIYTELMSRREEAESALRKDMFVSMIQSFLKPGGASLDERVLNLELLCYNFHESLNLKPLFVHLEKEIRRTRDLAREDYLERVYKVASETSRKQMLVLEGAGAKFDRIVDLDELDKTPGGIALDQGVLTVEGTKRYYTMVVQEADREHRELKVRLEVSTPVDTTGAVESTSAEFWVSFFDFPMIDNIRLGRDQRCAVVLNALEEGSADITLACFPGSYASLKEKPYYQEVVQNLMRVNEQTSRPR
jgi:hypothetical protein